MDKIIDNWEFVLLAFVALEKIVKKTPCKWDDVLFDMVIDPIFKNFAKKEGLKDGTEKE